MLHIFRQKDVRRNVLWFISGIIIISFGFGFGVSSYSKSVSLTDAAGKVFGKTISLKQYQDYYQATLDQAILMHGENYKKILPFINMENETWTRIMLIKQAQRRNVKVSDGEVIAFIQSMPFFQREGGFDQMLYENILRVVFNNRPAHRFEEGVRGQIMIMKMLRAETMAVDVSPEFVRKEYERRNQKTQVSYILIDPKSFANTVTVDDATQQAYYDSHKAEFMTPDSVKVAYLTLRLGENATDKEKAEAKSKADTLFAKLSKGADLTATAKADGLTVAETDFFSMDAPEISQGWSLELLQQIFAAKKNTVLAPAEAVSGIQILKVTDLKPSMIPEFSTIKEAVRARIVADKTLELAQAKATETLTVLTEKLSSGASFDSVTKDLKFAAQKTPFFVMGDYIPEIGISEDFQSAAVNLTKDKRLSPVVMTSKGPAILFWEGIEMIDEKKFEEVQKDFTATLLQEQQMSATNKVIKDIKEQAKLESFLDRLKQ